MHNSDYIRRLTTEAAELLKEMIAIPSTSFDEDAACGHVSCWLSEKGISHERVGNNIIACGITDPSKPNLMLCAHIDTVEPSPDYSFDPYKPDYEKAAEAVSLATGKPVGPTDIVAGLGSNDDGASAVAMIAAFRYFHTHSSDGMAATPNLVLVLTCEEERSGKNGMTGLWGSKICVRGEHTDGCIEIDHAIVGEPTGMKAATSERGLLVIDGTAHGVSGHAARNEGENALYIALEDIEKLRAHKFGKMSPRMGQVNMNITQIHAGTAHNVIPDRCDFVVDIRPTEAYSNMEILEELQAICRSELKPRNLSNRSSATSEDSPLQKAAEASGIETFSSPTTSDWMRIGCDAVKMGPGESSRSHKKDEYVLIDEIRKGIETYIGFICNYEHTLE